MTKTTDVSACLTSGSHGRLHRPESEVSDVTGLVGALTLCILFVAAKSYDMQSTTAMHLFLGGPVLAMILSALLVEKVHLRETTGLDFSLCHPWSDVFSITRTKFVGLGATFCLCVIAYFSIKTYMSPAYGFYFSSVGIAVPLIWLLSPIYISLTTRHMREPRDGLWHFGKLVCLGWPVVDYAQVKQYILAWTVKAFFLAFMVSILPGAVASILNRDITVAFSDPVKGIQFLVEMVFLFDICIGTIGYLMTFRLLDSHIRSANPFFSSWVAALACYPPFLIMGSGGPLGDRSGTQEWIVWFHTYPTLMIMWGTVILVLATVYAWATVVFGIRFSNLTHRGIITTGPYRFLRHPAYLSKNLMWWLVHMPFMSMAGATDALRNCILLLAVNAIYFARAKTEERHLMTDPSYKAYAEWIAENGLLARIFNVCGWRHFYKRRSEAD